MKTTPQLMHHFNGQFFKNHLLLPEGKVQQLKYIMCMLS